MESKPKVIVVTATYSKSVDDFRAKLAVKTVLSTVELGLGIVVVDGSPDIKFKEALKRAGAIVCDELEKGMGASRRQCIKKGFELGADVVVWTEPEKYPFIKFIKDLACGIQMDKPHLIIPCRKTLDSYPEYQRHSEILLNKELGSITERPDLDLTFGTRVINKLASGYFIEYKGERGDQWESIFIPVFRAVVDGVLVESKVVDYIHPPEQAEIESGDENMDRKRDLQRDNLVRAMQEESESLNSTKNKNRS